jgi:asparagine synthase (glutamine-hydrolysing)
MSVQAGLWNYDGRPVNRELLAKMSRQLTEYGPDGEATYFADSIGMLYRPFHTTAESRLERQPHMCATGPVMTWDGRLDNGDELISQLQDDLSEDRTDVAIVEAAFRRWGTGCFARMTGDWALVIWDSRDKELILARDFAGVRHLFYYPRPTYVIWCTHLEPLALCGDEFSLCEEYFATYIALCPEAHLTPYREVHSVPPGGFVRLHNGKISTHPYWTFDPGLTTRYKADAEYEEHFRHLFRRAVHRRLRTDSPILADLSGGLDSSSIVCVADDILMNEGAEAPTLDTFSALFLDEPGDKDPPYIGKVEDRRGRSGYHVELRDGSDSFSFEYPAFVATPEICGREDLNALKSGIIKRGGYRVLLDGTGGDEMLGQTLDPRVQLADLLRQLRLIELTKQLRAWSLLLRCPWMQLLTDALFMQLPVVLRIWHSDIAEVEPWVNEAFARKHRLSVRQLDAAKGAWFWRPSARDFFQTITGLTRQCTQAPPSWEEKRYPYLDQNLVDFLMSIPTEQLLRPGQRRSLMRRALGRILPPELLARRTKSTGGRSIAVSLSRHWDKVGDVLRSPVLSRLGYVKQAEFSEALQDVKNGKLSPSFLRLIRALFSELWLRDAIVRHVVTISPEMQLAVGTDRAELCRTAMHAARSIIPDSNVTKAAQPGSTI